MTKLHNAQLENILLDAWSLYLNNFSRVFGYMYWPWSHTRPATHSTCVVFFSWLQLRLWAHSKRYVNNRCFDIFCLLKLKLLLTTVLLYFAPVFLVRNSPHLRTQLLYDLLLSWRCQLGYANFASLPLMRDQKLPQKLPSLISTYSVIIKLSLESGTYSAKTSCRNIKYLPH